MNARSPQRRRRRDEVRDQFRTAILDAAEAVFAEKGLDAARIQDVASLARIAVGTVYNHFEKKEDVLAELLDDRMGEVIRLLSAGKSATKAREFVPCLTERLRHVLEYLEAHRGFFSLVMIYGVSPAPAESRVNLSARSRRRLERFRKAWRDVVEEGIACGALEKLDPSLLAASLAGTLRALIQGSMFDRTHEPLADRADVIVRLFVNGAGAGRGAA